MAGFGETLRQARAHKGVTLKEAEQATRINRHHLAALEEEDWGALPPLIYQRGIVRNYAVYLDLDPSKMLGMFEEAQGTTAGVASGVAPVPPIDMPSHWAPNFAIIAFALVLGAIVFAWGYSIYVTPPGEDPTATAESNTTPLASAIDLPTELPSTPVLPTPIPTEAPEPTATAAEVEEVSGRQDQTSRGDNQRNAASEPTAAIEEQAPVEDETSANAYRTGIAISAVNDVYLTAVVDGTTVFDGMLAAGEQTDQFVGTTFAITSSSGADTLFINSCGDTFPMGDTADEITSEFAANENSCKP